MRLLFLILSALFLTCGYAATEEAPEGGTRKMDTKEIVKFLEKEAKQGRKLLSGSNYEAAHEALATAAQAGIGGMGKDSSVATYLEEVLKESAEKSNPKDSSALLLAGMDKAVKALEFTLDKQAPLPKGFPPPGPPGIIQVKNYPKCRMVSRKSPAGKQTGETSMFMPLFRHIRRNNIPMAAPVETTHTTDDPKHLGTVSMSFIYPDPSTGKVGPEEDVIVEDFEPLQVVSIGVIGSYNDKNFREPLRELEGWLVKHADQYTTAGLPRRLGYNSPFVPWYKKFSEIQVPIKRRAEGKAKTDAKPPAANTLPSQP